jgi:hypothetical protein
VIPRPARWRFALAASIALIGSSSARLAGAALSDSEAAQVRDLYARGDRAEAGRLRALLARPDVSTADAAKILSEAARRAPFDEQRRSFVRELIFGPATQASRSELVASIVPGLLARSTEAFGASANDAARAEELVRIHAFVAHEIASAGKPPRDGHDPGAGIRDEAFKAAAAAYRLHLALPALERARLSAPLLVARAQAELALIELASGIHPSHEVAAWIGAGSNQRTALDKFGVLVIGLEAAPAAKASDVMQMLEALPPAARSTSALWIGKRTPWGLRGRRGILVAQTALGSARRAEPDRLWVPAVDPSTPDGALAEVAFVLGRAAAVHVGATNPAFGEAMDRALGRARARGESSVLAQGALAAALDHEGVGGALSRADLVGHGVQLLLLDASRVTSVALVRAASGRAEPMEQLALALGVLASNEDGKAKTSVVVGGPGGRGGVVPLEITNIKGTPAQISEFTLEGHIISIGRGADGAVTRVERDGRPLSLARIPFARVPTTPGETWTGRGAARKLSRLSGQPEVGFVDDARFIVRSGGKGKGRDAVAFKPPSNDFAIELELRVDRSPAAVILRSSAGSAGYAGAALVIEPTDPPRAFLVAFDGAGGKLPLAGPAILTKPGPTGHRVKAFIDKNRIEVVVSGQQLAAQLPGWLEGKAGDLAFAPGDKSEVEVRNLRVRPFAGK